MSHTYQSLSHSHWNCKDHVVCVPQRRRHALCGPMRNALGPILHALARQQACRILAGHVRPDHLHICIEIPPTHAVASVIGCLNLHMFHIFCIYTGNACSQRIGGALPCLSAPTIRQS